MLDIDDRWVTGENTSSYSTPRLCEKPWAASLPLKQFTPPLPSYLILNTHLHPTIFLPLGSSTDSKLDYPSVHYMFEISCCFPFFGIFSTKSIFNSGWLINSINLVGCIPQYISSICIVNDTIMNRWSAHSPRTSRQHRLIINFLFTWLFIGIVFVSFLGSTGIFATISSQLWPAWICTLSKIILIKNVEWQT